MTKTHILYLQLPLLDNDTKSERENFPFAGAYLDHALKQSSESAHFYSSFAPPEWDELDTQHLTQSILATKADIVACTLYLWNIERTLRLATRLKQENPSIKLIAGGPESAQEHPLLFSGQPGLDAVVTGEGEAVFPALLHHWRTGAPIHFSNLFVNGEWGDQPPPTVELNTAQPTEEMIMQCVQNRPVVYLETVRGCPLTCSYCRYYQLHSGLRKLTTEQVMKRIRRFCELGAREIRFVDPTFNARPQFTEFLAAIAELNHDRHLEFFAEIRSDTLTAEQARLMREANFTAVEVGVQSIDPEVLKNVARPVSLKKTGAGIQALCDSGVHVVLDIMYGLPGQTLTEVQRSLEWGLAFGDAVQVQCMQTLVLPGTVLRNDCKKWAFKHDSFPPYGIRETSHLSGDDIQEIELLLDELPNLPADPVTARFCSQRLAGLFKEQIRINMDDLETFNAKAHSAKPGVLGDVALNGLLGKENRRALLFRGAGLYNQQAAIAELIERSITNEPDGLWQFVLVPEHEEPLDLIEDLAECIRRQPPHLLDRFASAAAFDLTVSRRLYIRTNQTFSDEWTAAAEELLRESFG
jgi:pyruvate-formate lyase-activating enzyme